MTWGRRSLPALALVGLLILLGHDLLMAADPHAPTQAHEYHAVGHAPVNIDCGVQEGVPPASPGMVDLPIPDSVALMAPVEMPGQVLAQVAWDTPPRDPPDVIRALLQVFLN